MYGDECDIGDGETEFPLYATEFCQRVKTRHQRGYPYRKSGSWYLRYYEFDPAGNRVQKSRRLASHTDCPTKGAARRLADEFLAPLNEGHGQTSAVTLGKFVQDTYFPCIESQKRASTVHGYKSLWRTYLEPYNKILISEFRTSDGEKILAAIAQECDLNVTSLRHIKAFLSGVFRLAKRQGVLLTENPIRDVQLPRSRAAGETYAYSPGEIAKMIEVLPEPAATIVATAAFTGVRRGELRGLRWENYDGREIKILESWWGDTVAEPKTSKSKAPVPVIPQLAERLEKLRTSHFPPSNEGAKQEVTGLMFRKYAKSHICDISGDLPIDLAALAREVIIPTLKAHGIQWHGWHAFRRGLATNLHHLGIQDKVIQRILRHSNVAITQAAYIKELDVDVVAAMGKLAEASG